MNKLSDYVSGAEAARRLGISRQRLMQLTEKEGFPEPLGQLGRSNVWRAADIAAWAKANGRTYSER